MGSVPKLGFTELVQSSGLGSSSADIVETGMPCAAVSVMPPAGATPIYAAAAPALAAAPPAVAVAFAAAPLDLPRGREPMPKSGSTGVMSARRAAPPKYKRKLSPSRVFMQHEAPPMPLCMPQQVLEQAPDHAAGVLGPYAPQMQCPSYMPTWHAAAINSSPPSHFAGTPRTPRTGLVLVPADVPRTMHVHGAVSHAMPGAMHPAGVLTAMLPLPLEVAQPFTGVPEQNFAAGPCIAPLCESDNAASVAMPLMMQPSASEPEVVQPRSPSPCGALLQGAVHKVTAKALREFRQNHRRTLTFDSPEETRTFTEC